MDLTPSGRGLELQAAMWDLMRRKVLPAEALVAAFRTQHGAHTYPPMIEDLKQAARAAGLWNTFLPHISGLTTLDYAHIAEISGWSPVLAPEAINGQAPDSGNMELLHLFGSTEQKRQWLDPLLAGEIRSAFAMTEPDVASSDATNIATSIRRDGDSYVINGRKWWISGAADERCQIMIVMGKTDTDEAPYRQQSMILVPMDTPGVTVERHIPMYGYQDQHGHSEITFRNARVPASNLLGAEGDGFAMAQARLGPGRVHHAMRCIGMAERALALMADRAKTRVAFGHRLSDYGRTQDFLAESRIDIDQARLLVLQTAALIDTVGAKQARTEVAAIKIVAPRVAERVISRAIEVFGAQGLSDDTPLAYFHTWARALRVADGPDAVHLRSIARQELRRQHAYVG
ncbi:acyl-CoA dehydrogenase family protein [Intrasporangium sp.]|uniref:acyl-CoA dehydrogenase family protein n=1 Tax=Intrasporangium sp. TaxID=1925024 RepID=UPI00322148AC